MRKLIRRLDMWIYRSPVTNVFLSMSIPVGLLALLGEII
tara:strand:- start:1064 stop:1180 length:117 start_codon:yes stop_codon:yes gene_type:complete